MTEPRDVRPGTPFPSEQDCAREGDVVDFGGQRLGTGPCVDRDGRPVAHTAYVAPPRRNRLLWLSIAGAATLTLALVVLFFVGTPARPGASGMALRTALSPGPNSAPHSLASTDCVQCHQTGDNVEDARCERCHDPGVSARLSNAAHVFASTGDVESALSAPTVACATCHVEHRGADLNLKDVDDRECGTCHRVAPGARARLTTLAGHPEFAVLRAGVETGGGLKWFNHAQHLDKVYKKSKQRCEGCHETAPGSFDYQPISFDRHCSSCHNEDLSQSAGSLTPAMIAALGPLRAGISVQDDPDEPKLKQLTGITHADPWVLRSVQSLRRTMNPAGFAAERLVLDREVAQLELEQLFAEEQSAGAWLSAEHGERLTSRSASASPAAPDAAFRDLAAAVQTLPGVSKAELDALRAEVARLASLPGKPPPSGSAGQLPRTAALERLVEATIGRAKAAGNSELEARAAALLARLRASAGNRTPGTLEASGTGVEILLTEIARVRDPASREELREMMELARLSRRRAAGAMDPTAFDQHRQQTLALLDEIRLSLAPAAQERDTQANALLAREDSLRRLVLAMPYSVSAEAGSALVQFFRNRHLARTRIDVELQNAELRVGGAAVTAPLRAYSQSRLARIRERLAALGTAKPLALPASDAGVAVAALLGRAASDSETNALRKNRCTMCHELTPEGDQLAPVRAVGESLLPRARFTHRNHVVVSGDNCESCHTNIRSSGLAADVNLPTIASCRDCHAPGRQAARASGCETCHTYHVPSNRALRWQP